MFAQSLPLSTPRLWGRVRRWCAPLVVSCRRPHQRLDWSVRVRPLQDVRRLRPGRAAAGVGTVALMKDRNVSTVLTSSVSARAIARVWASSAIGGQEGPTRRRILGSHHRRFGAREYVLCGISPRSSPRNEQPRVSASTGSTFSDELHMARRSAAPRSARSALRRANSGGIRSRSPRRKVLKIGAFERRLARLDRPLQGGLQQGSAEQVAQRRKGTRLGFEHKQRHLVLDAAALAAARDRRVDDIASGQEPMPSAVRAASGAAEARLRFVALPTKSSNICR